MVQDAAYRLELAARQTPDTFEDLLAQWIHCSSRGAEMAAAFSSSA